MRELRVVFLRSELIHVARLCRYPQLFVSEVDTVLISPGRFFLV